MDVELLGWGLHFVDIDFVVPMLDAMSARFCLGSYKSVRIGMAFGQHCGTLRALSSKCSTLVTTSKHHVSVTECLPSSEPIFAGRRTLLPTTTEAWTTRLRGLPRRPHPNPHPAAASPRNAY